MSATPGTILGELRKLKTEEKALVQILGILKDQLNRLKIEELALAGKIRNNRVLASVANSSSSGNPSTSKPLEATEMVVDNPEDINKVTLNLTTAEQIFNSLPMGGFLNNLMEEDEEEEEDDDDTCDEADPLLAFLSS